MFKHTIEYKNLISGKKETEDLYFHLNEYESIQLELLADKPMSEILMDVGNSSDAVQAFQVFEMIINQAYGVRSSDGRRFIKNDDIRKEFIGSEPHSKFIMKMLQDPEFASDFIMSVLPEEMMEEALKTNPIQAKKLEAEKAKFRKIREEATKDFDIPDEGEVIELATAQPAFEEGTDVDTIQNDEAATVIPEDTRASDLKTEGDVDLNSMTNEELRAYLAEKNADNA